MDSHPQDAAERLTLASVGEAAPGRRGRFVRGRPGERPVKLSLLMPVYNEERTISAAISEVLAAEYPCEIELIVVDDGSTDAVRLILSRLDDPRLVVRHHAANLGKGAALQSAAAVATGTHVVPFDADLEYSASDLSRILEPVLNDRCDVVYGTRLFGLNTMYPTYRYAIGNRVLTLAANVLFDAYLSDLHTCLKLMPLELFRVMDLREPGFGIDTEITAKILAFGIRPFEVPVSYYGRSHDHGKKVTWLHGIESLRILSRVRLRWKPAVAQVEQAIEDDALEALEEQVREQLVRAASSPWQR
jgi:glycosyltransferase involved in cell wall biosynthesis